MEKQLSIFDYKLNTIKENILKKLNDYGIDQLYEKNFKDKTHTLFEIKNTLRISKNYKTYLQELAIELKKYLRLSDNIYQEFYEHKKDKSFQLIDEAIIIRTSNTIGPIFCVSMIKNEIFEME